MMSKERTLVYRFFSLPQITRLKIIQKLGLACDASNDASDLEICAKFFEQAIAKNILTEFKKAIDHEYEKDMLN